MLENLLKSKVTNISSEKNKFIKKIKGKKKAFKL